jgi:hypothetical protein
MGLQVADKDFMSLVFGGKSLAEGVVRNPQNSTVLTVNYAGLDSNSWLIAAVTDGDLQSGDVIFYDNRSAAGKVVQVSSTGVPTILAQTQDDSFNYRIIDISNDTTKVGPGKVTLDGPN